MFTKFTIILTIFAVNVSCIQNFGIPAGFMSDCPGMNKTTTLSEKTKESLSVVVIKPTSGGFFKSFMAEKRCSLSVKGANCTAAHINLIKKKTQVVISGYLDSASSPLVRAIVQPYLDRGLNVIVVEIFPLLVRTYPLAARVTRPFGTLLGEYLAALTHLGLSPERLELLGGSLGAHIASYASVRFFELTGRRPARITGLDPAGPCFRNLPYGERLNRHAAQRVDVLHTNIDGFGIADPLGHVDFYANGGEFQQSMKKGFLMPCLSLCSHVRAALYWIKACLHPEDFQAVRCGSVADARHGACYDTNASNLLGPKTDFTKTGIYFLPTNEYPPYYRGADGLKRRSIGINTYLLQVAPDDDVTI